MENAEKPEYEYPERLSRAGRQEAALRRLGEHKKMRSQMIKNLVLAAVIAVLGFFCSLMVMRIVLWLIALGDLAVGLLLYHWHLMTADEGQYLRVYPDRLEHRMSLGLTGRYLSSVIYFDEVVSTSQDKLGRLNVTVSPGGRSSFVTEEKSGTVSPYELKNGTAVLRFPEAAPKLKLIEAYWEKLRYPKKEYKTLDDSDDYYSEEDMEWDRLHKHGL